ncbi:ATP-binding cassette domain-containing protein [uncultured Ruegeria sp.]|uniref:ATP-binding cassette domain-containing protein n=1 Tax=uncultured Ruegeria sp. TaxID=259304 RepID=UPI002616C2B8|nr:ATP-binding cassette domain-containing protein [uncultured Ruegeria sp.]
MADTLLQGKNLNKRFGGVVAVDDVSISIDPLEVKCVIGANGAGKSSLFNLLCGAMKPDSGELVFEGQSIIGLPLYKFSRIGIARKFQIPSVFDSLTVGENLETAILGRMSSAEVASKTADILRQINLGDIQDQPAGSLAHGQKQWLEIGMAIMSNPKLLLLDEPTAGMTPDETQTTAELIHGLAERMAVIAIEHDMGFVRALACHTYVMHQGKMIVEGDFSDIENDKLVRDVYLGRA